MVPSHELFHLVKSLTKSEKRFFKLFSSIQSGEKNYFKLFDYIDGISEYDEEILKAHFKGERFINHLPSEKNHLYKLILKSLRQFHSDQLITSVLQQELKNIEILYNKALYKEAKKFLDRAKKNAHANEAFYMLTDLISWEKILIEESYESGDFDVDLNRIIEEESDVIDKLRNLAEYFILYSRINAIFRSDGFTKNEEQRKLVDEISNHHLIKGKDTALSIRAASICYYIQGLCAATNRDFETSYQKFNRVRVILDRNLRVREDTPQRYILTLTHLIQCYVSNKDFEKAQNTMEQIAALRGQKGFSSVQINLRISNILLTEQIKLFNLQGKFEKAFSIYEDQFKENKKLIERSSKENRIKFYFNVAYTLFALHDYKESLNFINRILNDNEQRLRQDLYSFARIMNILVHFELNNLDYIEHLSGSTLRYLNKVERDHKIELTFIKQLRKIARVANNLDAIEIYKDTLDEVLDLLKNENEKVILDYIDVVSWLKSKISGESFIEIVQKSCKLKT